MRSLQRPGRSPVLAPEGMASTSHPLSTQAAVNILQNGGNAMDAALAACAVQAVVDDKLRIHGLQNLRVIDASIMPSMPSANLNAAVMMIAEKGADMVLGKPPL